MLSELKEYSDENLMEMIISGNHDAFALLVKRHLTNSYKTAFKFVRSKEDAEDIVQNCFLKLWKSPQNFNQKHNVKFSTWFSTVIRNCSFDFLKKKGEEFLDEDFDLEDPSPNQLQIIENNSDEKTLEKALENLQDNQKQAIKLCFLENHKHQESAKIMGLSLKAFQSLLMRSKKSLKLFLQPDPKFYERK